LTLITARLLIIQKMMQRGSHHAIDAIAIWSYSTRVNSLHDRTNDMTANEPLIPEHGGYRKLKSFQVAQLVFDITVREKHDRGLRGQSGQCGQKEPSASAYTEIAANAALVLLAVACSLLDRQLAAQAAAFETEGGFTERLYRVRSEKRSLRSSSTRSTKSTPSTSD
jgi:four helix bundle suffix protein